MQTDYRARPASRRSGRTASARGTTARRRQEASRSQGREKDGLRLAQLIVCAGIFVLLAAGKFVFPAGIETVRGGLNQLISENVDYKAAFSAVGQVVGGKSTVQEAMNELYIAVFRAQDGVEEVRETMGYRAEEKYLAAFSGDGAAVLNHRLGRNGALQQTKPEQESGEETQAQQQKTGTQAAQAVPLGGNVQTEPVYTGPALPEGVSMKREDLGISCKNPVTGQLSSPFGYREHPIENGEKFHYGIDIAVDVGTAVGAFADGTVVAVGESSSLGKYVEITHAKGITTLYAHCSKLCVTSGQKVKMGGKIAESGDTGLSTGPHLHFELRRNDVYLNPAYYVTLGA